MAFAGKTAPRLINDLLDHDPRYKLKDGRNILADPAPIYRTGAGNAVARKHPFACRHQLMAKDGRIIAPASNTERPNTSTKYVINAFCSDCSYHFEISVKFWKTGNAQSPCQLSDELNPLHHFRRIESAYEDELRREFGDNKYLTPLERHRFECSGAKCPTTLEIKIFSPRLSESLLKLVTDPKLVYERSKHEIANDPVRFEKQSPLEIIQVIGYLRQYLVDAKSGKGQSGRKRIAKRNKKYVLAFSDKCESIF